MLSAHSASVQSLRGGLCREAIDAGVWTTMACLFLAAFERGAERARCAPPIGHSGSPFSESGVNTYAPKFEAPTPPVSSELGRDPLSGKSSDAINLGYSGVGHLPQLWVGANFSGMLHLCALRAHI